MRKARLLVVMLLVGTGVGGAYFSVRAQDGRSPWPPRPIVPPDIDDGAALPAPATIPTKKPAASPPVFPTDPRAKKKLPEPPPPLPTPTAASSDPLLTPSAATNVQSTTLPAPLPELPAPTLPAPTVPTQSLPAQTAPTPKTKSLMNAHPEAMPDPAFPPIQQVSFQDESQVKIPIPKIEPPPPLDPPTMMPQAVPQAVPQSVPKPIASKQNSSPVSPPVVPPAPIDAKPSPPRIDPSPEAASPPAVVAPISEPVKQNAQAPAVQAQPVQAQPVPTPSLKDNGPAPFRIVHPLRRPGQLSPSAPGGLNLAPDAGNPDLPLVPLAQSVSTVPGPVLASTQTPNVTLEKIGPAQLKAGERQTYAIVVRNQGNVPARNVRIDDDLSAGLRVTSADPQPALQSDKSSTWLMPMLIPGEEHKIRIEFQASADAVLNGVTTLTVSGSTSGHTVHRLAAATLMLSAHGPAGGAPVGQPAVVEIRYANKGAQPLRGVILRVILPPGLTHPKGSAIEGDIGELAAGAAKVQKLTTITRQPGRHVVQVEIAASSGEKAVASAEVHVLPAGAIQAGATQGSGAVQRAMGSLAVAAPALPPDVRQVSSNRMFLRRESELKIEVSNPNSSPLKNVAVVDVLPEALEFAGASDRGLFQQETRTAHWLIDSLPAGQTRTLTLKVQGKSPGEFENEVIARTDARQEAKSKAKVSIEGMANLAVTVRDRNIAVEVGRPTVYQIRVVNEGTVAATGIEVQASLPEGLAAGNCQGPTPFRLEGRQVIFAAVPRLEPQGEAVFIVNALAQTPGQMRFLAQVSSNQDRTPITREARTTVYPD